MCWHSSDLVRGQGTTAKKLLVCKSHLLLKIRWSGAYVLGHDTDSCGGCCVCSSMYNLSPLHILQDRSPLFHRSRVLHRKDWYNPVTQMDLVRLGKKSNMQKLHLCEQSRCWKLSGGAVLPDADLCIPPCLVWYIKGHETCSSHSVPAPLILTAIESLRSCAVIFAPVPSQIMSLSKVWAIYQAKDWKNWGRSYLATILMDLETHEVSGSRPFNLPSLTFHMICL